MEPIILSQIIAEEIRTLGLNQFPIGSPEGNSLGLNPPGNDISATPDKIFRLGDSRFGVAMVTSQMFPDEAV